MNRSTPSKGPVEPFNTHACAGKPGWQGSRSARARRRAGRALPRAVIVICRRGIEVPGPKAKEPLQRRGAELPARPRDEAGGAKMKGARRGKRPRPIRRPRFAGAYDYSIPENSPQDGSGPRYRVSTKEFSERLLICTSSMPEADRRKTVGSGKAQSSCRRKASNLLDVAGRSVPLLGQNAPTTPTQCLPSR